MAFSLAHVENGERVVLDKAVILIGRHPDCDIVLENSRKVSRRHCCIAQVNDVFIVRDLGSMNGVRVNGNRIDQETRIHVGDEVAFGDIHYVLESREAPAKSPVESPADAHAPNGHHTDAASPRPGQKHRQPVDLSQKFPVPIDDEDGEEFAVEPSLAIPEGISPIFDDEAEFPIIEDVDEVILLEDSGEQRGLNNSRV